MDRVDLMDRVDHVDLVDQSTSGNGMLPDGVAAGPCSHCWQKPAGTHGALRDMEAGWMRRFIGYRAKDAHPMPNLPGCPERTATC
jgi:hypothetical protein